MELKLNLTYSQILKLIHQLQDKDKEKLASALHREISSKKTNKRKIQELILNAPTWSDEQLLEYQTAREHLNNPLVFLR